MLEVFGLAALVGMLGGPAAVDAARTWWKRRRGGGAAGGQAAAPAVVRNWQRWAGARPEPRGCPRDTILAVPGLDKHPPAVRAALLDVAEALAIPVDSLAILISHESGWKAEAFNGIAYGLIQLTKGAGLAGYREDLTLKTVLSMGAEAQLRQIVQGYYARAGAKVRGMTPGELVLQNFLPKYVGQPDSFVLSRAGEAVYEANKNLAGAAGGDKSVILIADVYARAEAKAAEAHGERLAVDGRRVGASTAAPPLPASKPAAAPAPAPKPAPAPAPKPAPAPAAKPPLPLPAPAPPEAADAPPTSPFGLGHAPVKQLPAEFADAGDHPEQFGIGRPGARPGSPPGSPPATESATVFEDVQRFAEEAAGGDGGEGAGLAISGLAVAGASVRGLMLAAVQAGSHEQPVWTPLELPDQDLRVYVLHAPLRCRVSGRWLALGMSYRELVEVCRSLAGGAANGGAVPPTAAIVDAAWQAAKASGHVIQAFGLNQGPGDDALMDSIAFAARHNNNVEKQTAAFPTDTFARDYGKDWCIDAKMLRLGVAEYGWRLPSGAPIQPLGPGGHDADYTDYSMVCANICQRSAERISTGEHVDLCDVYDQMFGNVPGMAAKIAEFR
jgi:hypothetical protein